MLQVEHGRSGCPINMTVELLGDRWSFVVLRDIMFGDRRRFRELLRHSEERIASNVLASRLKRMSDVGLLTRQDRKSTRLNSSHVASSYAVFCLKKKKRVRTSGCAAEGQRSLSDYA